jgi:hypothetical protein
MLVAGRYVCVEIVLQFMAGHVVWGGCSMR